MRSREWMARLVAVTAVGVSVPGLAAAGASAAILHSPGAPDAIRHAAQSAAPLVADSGPPRDSKRGLAAPDMTASMLSANARKQAAAARILQVMSEKASPRGRCASLPCLTGLPAAKNLLASQQAQVLDYFCGPATVSEPKVPLYSPMPSRKSHRRPLPLPRVAYSRPSTTPASRGRSSSWPASPSS